jgi:hypothetical protein
MYVVEQLASDRTRGHLDEAEQLRHCRRLRTLRRARRIETRAEHRMVQAWRRAADLRSGLEFLDS